MVYKIRIRRQESQKSDSYWQEFEFDGSKNSSVANVLKELNSRTPLKDDSGNIVTPISWECSCMVRKCGACAMLINERPRLACSTFLHMLKGSTITLEPLSKFPLVRDLIVDRSNLFENLKKLNLWLESEAYRKGRQWQQPELFSCLLPHRNTDIEVPEKPVTGLPQYWHSDQR